MIWDLKLRPENIRFCSDIWQKTSRATYKLSFSFSSCTKDPLTKRHFYQIAKVQFLRTPQSFDQPITPSCGDQGQRTLSSTKPAFHPPGCLLCSWAHPPCGHAWWAVCSSPRGWAYVTSKLLSMSPVQCWVSCLWPLAMPISWGGHAFFISGLNRRQRWQSHALIYTLSGCRLVLRMNFKERKTKPRPAGAHGII